MKDIVASMAAGKADGHVLLDLNKEEDNFGEADVPMAIVPSTGEIVLLQMDGNMTREEFDRAIELGVGGCKKIYELQKDALKRRYSAEEAEEEDDSDEQ
jgi:exosome complex component RRP41